MRLRGTLTALLIATAALSAGAPAARAQGSDADRATARALGHEGQEALDRKDYTTAADRFARAEALFHAPTLLLGLARAQAGLGRLVSAQETYNRIVREGPGPSPPPAFVQAVDDAKAELRALESRIPWLVLRVDLAAPPESTPGAGPHVTITLDGAPFPPAAVGVRRAIDPGKHVVRAEAPGHAPAEQTFTVQEGATQTVHLKLERISGAAIVAPAAAPSPAGAPSADAAPASRSSGQTMRTLAYVSFGLAGLGIAAGAATGVIAIQKHGQLTDACSGTRCPPSQADEVRSYRMMGGISTVGIAIGVAGIAGGITLLALAPSRKANQGASVTPFVGAGLAGAVGRF